MAAERRLSVDWPACKGHGLCAELVPELITLDEWGYPILADRAVTRGVQSNAKRAVAACPTLALVLEEQEISSTPRAADPISGAIAGFARTEPVRSPSPTPQPARSAPATQPVRSAPLTQPVQRAQPQPVQRAQPQPVQRAQSQPTQSQPVQPTRRGRQAPSRPIPADDPITGAIQAVTGPNAVPRRTPPTGMARHATPAYGQPSLISEPDAEEAYHPFFDGYDAQERPPAQPRSRREARNKSKR
ncbi:ferredoxin [Kineosporia sp. NBRC 101731]|uniref:ferredoxin n=1 Tax=Kineosporia sp. NBRC 101731 TaxID=3032199 RepID=UPI0024A28DF7|nr:ferredoxin [Kineosporia sp. NBRC 101731]GLY26712.1 hypothetical protein Kisp02_00770 [Kineosporia sp. NBRC 101731]